MSKSTIQFAAFFHTGQDLSYPQALVKSLRHHNASLTIIQISPPETRRVEGISEFVEYRNNQQIMLARLEAFSMLAERPGGLYLDTDMLALKDLLSLESEIPIDFDTMLCRRTCDTVEPLQQRSDIDISEHVGKKLGDVFPFVACLTYTRSPTFWRECAAKLLQLPAKYRVRYGDQLAMRMVYEEQAPGQSIGQFLEKDVAAPIGHLPSKPADMPTFLHFKGPANKTLHHQMATWTYGN